MDVWPLGAAGRVQHWSCQTGWGGCIRSSSPSSGVNRRSGTFTQPLTSGATSEVMIKVRGQRGPQRSWRPQAPPGSSSPCLCSLLHFSPLTFLFPSSSICFFFAHALCSPRRDQLRHPIPWECEKESKRKSIGKMSEDLEVPSKTECFSVCWHDSHIHKNTYRYTAVLLLRDRKAAVNSSLEIVANNWMGLQNIQFDGFPGQNRVTWRALLSVLCVCVFLSFYLDCIHVPTSLLLERCLNQERRNIDLSREIQGLQQQVKEHDVT